VLRGRKSNKPAAASIQQMQSPPLAQLHRVSVVSLSLSFPCVFSIAAVGVAGRLFFLFRNTSCETCHPRIRSLLPRNHRRRGPPRRRSPYHIQKVTPRAHHGCQNHTTDDHATEKEATAIGRQIIRYILRQFVLRPHLSPLLIQTRSLRSPSFFLPYTTQHFEYTTTTTQSSPTTTTFPPFAQPPPPRRSRSIPVTTAL
jgi:hypothetical protein